MTLENREKSLVDQSELNHNRGSGGGGEEKECVK